MSPGVFPIVEDAKPVSISTQCDMLADVLTGLARRQPLILAVEDVSMMHLYYCVCSNMYSSLFRMVFRLRFVVVGQTDGAGERSGGAKAVGGT